MEIEIQTLVGIDEAGRGPLAGPVAVGVVAVPLHFDWQQLPGVNDSKRVSPENREAIFRRAREFKRDGLLDFRVRMISAPVIDRIGITRAVALGIQRGCDSLVLDPRRTSVKLDGLLRAPERFMYQETIIRGDARELVIGLASILAKVTRDRYMVGLSRSYPAYGFERHKGYGTRAHREAIRRHRLSPVHRASFCKSLRIG